VFLQFIHPAEPVPLIKVAYWCPNRPVRGMTLIPATCTIQQLKQRLESRTEIPAINQLLFASRELDGSFDTTIDEPSPNLQSLLVPHTTNQQHPIIHLMVVSNQDSPLSPAASSNALGHNHQEILEAHAIISNLVDQLQGSWPSSSFS